LIYIGEPDIFIYDLIEEIKDSGTARGKYKRKNKTRKIKKKYL